jgi:hypothetical protein
MSLALVVAALVVVAINAFFVAAEYAIIRVRTTRIEELVSSGVRRAAAARDVLRPAGRLDLRLPARDHARLAGARRNRRAGVRAPVRAGVAFLGARSARRSPHARDRGVVPHHHVPPRRPRGARPKTLAITHAENTALLVAWPLRVFRFLFYPLIVFMKGAAGIVIRAWA